MHSLQFCNPPPPAILPNQVLRFVLALLGVLPSKSQLRLPSGTVPIPPDPVEAEEPEPALLPRDPWAPAGTHRLPTAPGHPQHRSRTLSPTQRRAERHLSSPTLSSDAAKGAPLSTPTKPLITRISVAGELAVFYLPRERGSESNCTFWRVHAINYPMPVFYQDAITLEDNGSFLGCYSRDHKVPPSAATSRNCLSLSESAGNFSIIKTGLACIKKRFHQLSLWNQATLSDVRDDNG